jgi:hypothetical protein
MEALAWPEALTSVFDCALAPDLSAETDVLLDADALALVVADWADAPTVTASANAET